MGRGDMLYFSWLEVELIAGKLDISCKLIVYNDHPWFPISPEPMYVV